MGSHIIDGEFQSDKYPTCPAGKVPLSTKDPLAQDLLWIYAQRRRAADTEFSEDLETALRMKKFAVNEDFSGLYADLEVVTHYARRKQTNSLCQKELQALHAERAAAAGELLININDMPPGSTLGKVVSANRILKGDISKLRADLDRVTKELDNARKIIVRVSKEQSEASALLGAVIVASTLGPGETMTGVSGHAAIQAMVDTREALHYVTEERDAAVSFGFGDFHAEHIIDTEGADYGWVVSNKGKWEGVGVSREEAINLARQRNVEAQTEANVKHLTFGGLTAGDMFIHADSDNPIGRYVFRKTNVVDLLIGTTNAIRVYDSVLSNIPDMMPIVRVL